VSSVERAASSSLSSVTFIAISGSGVLVHRLHRQLRLQAQHAERLPARGLVSGLVRRGEREGALRLARRRRDHPLAEAEQWHEHGRRLYAVRQPAARRLLNQRQHHRTADHADDARTPWRTLSRGTKRGLC
jgi:hypothetical protein